MKPEHNSLLLLLPLFPAIGALINGLFGLRIQKAFGKGAVHAIAIAMPAISCLLAWTIFFQLLGKPPEERAFTQVGWDWITVGFADARFAFWVDPLTSMMLLIITTIGTMIHVYSVGYMAEEPAYWRFFCYLNLFVTMMLILVLGDSFLLMFVGWEGVGLASYLLIGFYYKELANAAAGMKAFVVNRFGDACFVIGLFLLFWGLQGHWLTPTEGHKLDAAPSALAALEPDFVSDEGARAAEDELGVRPFSKGEEKAEAKAEGHAAHEEAPVGSTLRFAKLREILESPERREALVGQEVFGIPLVFLICLLFFLGATAKSAQLPFYVWLPDAMAGPTPVSALIHAATMVTAGVYMIARLNFLYILSPGACTVVGLVGAATALFAASMGLFQYDIKKVLAYSTISQLGFMFIGVGVGAYWAGTFHLLTHACFKACLFLGSGSVILGCHHEQDMRRMGGLDKYMPTTRWTYLAACIAIAGFPVAAGFCSKDEILWRAFSSTAVLPMANYLIWALGLAAATLTAFYMGRSYYMTFSGTYRGNDVPLEDPYPADTARAKELFIPKPVRGPTEEMLKALAEHGHGHGHGGDGHGHEEHGHDAHGHDAHGHDAHGHDDHGHGHGPHTPHESPASMTWVLSALGAASLLIGVILGFPAVLHLPVPILLEHWLEPVMEPSNQMIALYDAARPSVSFVGAEGTRTLVEMGLALMSVAVASAGWFGARMLYKDAANDLPDRLLHAPGALLGALGAPVRQVHRLIYNKYFVDEGYYTAVLGGGAKLWNACAQIDKRGIDGLVNLLGTAGRALGYLQGAVDKYLVDGAVNLVADVVMASGQRLRRLQTGQVRNYLLGAFGGAVAAFMLLVVLS
jgi:NADH-quinone oxidoreductase subunit L